MKALEKSSGVGTEVVGRSSSRRMILYTSCGVMSTLSRWDLPPMHISSGTTWMECRATSSAGRQQVLSVTMATLLICSLIDRMAPLS